MAHVPKREANGGRTQSTPAAGPRSPAQGGTEEEKKLVRRAQGGDALAYEELVRGHQQRIFAVVGGILRRREDIEDVAQQVFMKAYFSLRRFDLRSAFGTWLYKIAVNECWDYLRKKRVRSEEHTSELQSRLHLVCRLLLEKKKTRIIVDGFILTIEMHSDKSS